MRGFMPLQGVLNYDQSPLALIHGQTEPSTSELSGALDDLSYNYRVCTQFWQAM